LNKIRTYAVSIIGCLIFVSCLINSSYGQSSDNVLPNNSKSLPIDYTNYTSDKYHIQFEYPLNWIPEKNTNEFEGGSFISNPEDASDQINFAFMNDFSKDLPTSDIEYGTKFIHDGLLNSAKYEVQSINSPSLVKIDGKTAGTFVSTLKERFSTNPIAETGQYWLTKVGNNGYFMVFKSTKEKFDSPENTEIRNHFIKSIKFLGNNNATRTNATSN
jgi:hypothetical protein